MKLTLSALLGLSSLVLADDVSPTSRHWTTRIRSTATPTPTSTSQGVITSVTVLPPRTSSTSTTELPCPRVTSTMSPDGCDPIRCPVPTCAVTSSFVVPCGCEPKTVLFVTGCQTECPTGCLTRTRTTSLACTSTEAL
ncbi:hypothetical protein C7999DRAFT_30849 [Corynascus novoguineensis]|uniref:Uncharacterized protein n=1 Tax=Corynascus novoguineensis TaxID=1126955 RepID=A0AAN7HRS0_9PEZI|nr:hypothetical protein C7999DRAFT_30849 [Corynascus novoguineensis]